MRFKSCVFGASVTVIATLMGNPALAGGWDMDFFNYESDPGVWNKLYVGTHIGGAQGDSDWFLGPQYNNEITSPGLDTGVIFGGQVGLLHQFGPLVAGVEASFSRVEDLDGTSSPCFISAGSFKCQNQINNLLLVNGRLGYAFGPLLL